MGPTLIIITVCVIFFAIFMAPEIVLAMKVRHEKKMAEQKDRPEPIPCLGVLGKLLGHKFDLYGSEQEHCQRCGIPKGKYKGQRDWPTYNE